MTNGRINKRSALLAILCVLVMVFAVPVASAASYSKVYGQTQDKVRVRESASTNATIIDNIVKDACIYITSSKTSGSNTFVQVKYRASDGSTATGWVCQSDGRNTYVKVLSTDQAKSKFKVSSGDLPSKAVGTFTAAERKASAANSDTTYIRENSSGATVSKVQTELKALGYYYGQITGNAGPKTVAAIKSFQGKNGLTADGIAGPQTIAKIDAAYKAKGSSSSGSGSSASGLKLNSKGTDVRNLQQDLTTLGYYWAEITGNFGERTEAAVKAFQKAKSLTADGIGAVVSYIHMGGKVGVLLSIKAGKEETVKSDAFKALAKDLTLHIAAAAPKSVSSDSLDPAFVAEEQEIAKQQLIQEGKPEHLLEKILPGKLKALYAQSCLLNQVFVKDPAGKMTVEALLNQAGKELGDDISVASFVRYQLGA